MRERVRVGAAAAGVCVAAVLAGAACSSNDAREPGSEVEQASTSVCPKQTVEGIDISAGQGTVDWTTVKGSGRAFAFIKATQGDYYTSNEFASQWAGAKTAGILRSPYHFFDPTIDGVAQAKHFLAIVGALGPGDLPPMLDIECPTSSNQATTQKDCEYGGATPNSGWAPSATISQRVHDWLDYVQTQTGRTPFVYSYNSWFQSVGFDSTTLVGKYPFYVSWPSTSGCYTVGSGNAFTSALVWQWSVTGTCPGVTGTVDLDRFIGTVEDLRHLALLDLEAGAPDAGAGDGGSTAHGDAASSSDGAASPSDAAPDGDPGAASAAAASAESGGCAVSARARSSPYSFLAVGLGVAAALRARRRGRRVLERLAARLT